jgi:hypothetical protein
MANALAGWQQALLPTVEPYLIENPVQFQVGDRVVLKDGTKFVGAGSTRFAIGTITQIFKSGLEISSEGYALKQEVKLYAPELEIGSDVIAGLATVGLQTSKPAITPEEFNREMARSRAKLKKPTSTPKRREPCGWIEERVSNPQRNSPTTCYYFGYYEVIDGERRKQKIYVPQNQMSTIWQMVKEQKLPYYETLGAIRKTAKPHHTDSRECG